MLNYAIFFIIYAFLGWVCEEIYCSIKQRKLVIRGFLFGPLCPIYGVGALMMVFFLSPYKEHWYYLFIIAFISLSVLEYITSYLMEKIFRMRWWDYSNYKVNINGRVCLLNSVLFVILAMILIYLLHPLSLKLCDVLTNNSKLVFVIVVYSLFVIDLGFSIYSAAKSSSNFKKYLAYFKEETEIFKEKILHSKFPGFFLRHTLRNFPRIFHIKNRMTLIDLINKIKERKEKKKEEITEK